MSKTIRMGLQKGRLWIEFIFEKTLGNPTHEDAQIKRVGGSDRFNVQRLEGDRTESKMREGLCW